MMPKSVNRVELIGTISADPEIYYPSNDLVVCCFWLVTPEIWYNEGGERESHFEWHRIVVWQKLAEVVYQSFSKGSLAYVSGRLHTRVWSDAQEQTHAITEVIAEHILLLHVPSEGQLDENTVPEETDRLGEPYMPPKTPDLGTRKHM
jgi:single-strand DNA-binding protein